MRAKLLIAALLPVFTAFVPVSAYAALCENLRSQLNRTSEVTGNTAEVRKYGNALAQQNLNIRKVRNDMQRYGCSTGSFTVFGGRNQAACDQLQAALTDMDANRNYLERQRDALRRDVSGSTSERRRILSALRENGCNGDANTGTVQEASLVTPAPIEKEESEFFTRIPSPGETGQLRTMCVRTCDGSFFPISSNASTSDFQRDAAICSNMCPGTEAKLYYHSLTNGESSDMVSATTGEPYRALPNAFAYRNRLPGEKPVCGCSANSAAFSAPDSGEDASEVQTELRPTIAAQSRKPESPVTSAAAASVPDRPYDPANSKVRVIGPQFVPSTSGSLQSGNEASQIR